MKCKNLIYVFFIVAFLVISSLPISNSIIFFRNGGQISNVSKKMLFNGDHLEGIRNYVFYKVFGISLVDKVVIGKNGFLFLSDKYNKVVEKTTGKFRPKNNEIKEFSSKIKKLQDWYEERGIKFIVVIAPNKHSIYKENLPEWAKYDGENITDDIVKESLNLKVNMLDLRKILIASKDKGLLYWKTDTHWNEKGASIAYNEIISYINNTYDVNITIPQYTLTKSFKPGGDLARFLKIGSILGGKHGERYNYDFSEKISICKGKIDLATMTLKDCKETENQYIHFAEYSINKNKKDKLLFLCDSFGEAPAQLYNATFGAVWKLRRGAHSQKQFSRFIDNYKPDIVIYQIVERDFYDANFNLPLQ